MRTTLILAAVLVAAATAAPAADCTALETKVAAAATAADHEAIAACYDERAKVARASSEEHRKLGDVYGAYTRAPVGKLQFWCQAFTKTLEAEAKTYEEMAAAHREMAKSAK